MTVRIANVKIALNDAGAPLQRLAAKILNIPVQEIADVKLVKKSVDARDKGDVHFVCTLEVTTKKEIKKHRQ